MTDKSLLVDFYETHRLGKDLADNGGPFGFDIHHALEVDYCIKNYNCDAIFETGTNAGDTTEFLAKRYPHLQIITSEVNLRYYNFAKERLKKYDNVLVLNESSEKAIEKYKEKYKQPFYYLDAHWEKYWPLKDELINISNGVICVSDFYIGEVSIKSWGFIPVAYGYDNFDGKRCDSLLITKCIETSTPIYINNVLNILEYEYPCHQFSRRSGRGYFCKGIDIDLFKDCKYFREDRVNMEMMEKNAKHRKHVLTRTSFW